MGAAAISTEGDMNMKPAEIVTAVVSIPVVAAFLISAMASPVETPVPTKTSIEAPAALAQNVADEVVVVAKRAAAQPS
jgi:hypothetical protein